MLVKIQPDSLEGHLGMASRLLRFPGLQARMSGFQTGQSTFEDWKEKQEREEMKTTVGVLQMGIVCVRHGGCSQFSGSRVKIKMITPSTSG